VRYLWKREIIRNYILSLRKRMREYVEEVIKDRYNNIIKIHLRLETVKLKVFSQISEQLLFDYETKKEVHIQDTITTARSKLIEKR